MQSAEKIQILLQKSNKKISETPLSQLISKPGRFQKFSLEMNGILLDYSRVHLDEDALDLLLQLAKSRNILPARDRLFGGESVNFTENRPAMHMALRSRELGRQLPDAEFRAMEEAMDRMLVMADSLHRGQLPADPDARVRNIVHVGIGGSMLGTRLLCEALVEKGESVPSIHFLGSVDAHDREQLLPGLDPAETVVILASKSFTTLDTLMHGRRIREWLIQALGQEAASQRIFAICSDSGRAAEFGIPGENSLHLPEWVGGRYSLWSPVSLSAAAVCGPGAFRELLEGAAEMDRHFLEAVPEKNLPVLLGLLGVWHRNICDYSSWGVIPYDQRLRLLPAHLQQLIMESTGKSVTYEGKPVENSTAPVVFGECGTDAQHSLFQAMHQGSDRVPLNLVGVIRPDHEDNEAQAELLANLLAQATAFATGRTADETLISLESESVQSVGSNDTYSLLAHRIFEGNRPSELILLDDLSPPTWASCWRCTNTRSLSRVLSGV